jgi:hypothetical protein
MLKTDPNIEGFLPTTSITGIETVGTFTAGDDRVNENPALTVMHIGTDWNR